MLSVYLWDSNEDIINEQIVIEESRDSKEFKNSPLEQQQNQPAKSQDAVVHKEVENNAAVPEGKVDISQRPSSTNGITNRKKPSKSK